MYNGRRHGYKCCLNTHVRYRHTSHCLPHQVQAVPIWLVMPFGLTICPSCLYVSDAPSFLRPPRSVCGCLFRGHSCFQQDGGEHQAHLREVLSRLRLPSFMPKFPSATSGRLRFISWVNPVVTSSGIQVEETKVQAICNWPPPHDVSSLSLLP